MEESKKCQTIATLNSVSVSVLTKVDSSKNVNPTILNLYNTNGQSSLRLSVVIKLILYHKGKIYHNLLYREVVIVIKSIVVAMHSSK